METKNSTSITFAWACVLCISSAQAEQSITGVTSDLDGFWQSSVSVPSLVAVDSLHNLTSVTADGVTISTGVDDMALGNSGVVFTPGEFRAFIPELFQSGNAGQGGNDDGDAEWVGPLYPIVDNDVTPYLTDGINGLGLSTFGNNMAASIDFNFYMIDAVYIDDGQIDFLYFNTAAGGASEVSFTLLDADDNPLGTSVGSSENAHPDIADVVNDRFNSTPPYASTGTASLQTLTGFGLELSEFGLTTQQLGDVRKIRVSLPAAADPPFIAYNSLALLACATGDDDNDGICNLVEGADDSDGDGTADYLDDDSDNDGIPDAAEGQADTDADGTPDFLDLDSDADGISDAVEGRADADGDNIPNSLDTDSDNDGLPDYIEGAGDADSDRIADFLDSDSDGDGVNDSAEGMFEDRMLLGIGEEAVDASTEENWTASIDVCPAGYVTTESPQFAANIGWNNKTNGVGSSSLSFFLNETMYSEIVSSADEGDLAQIVPHNGGSAENTEATVSAMRIASSTFRDWTHRSIVTTAPSAIESVRIEATSVWDDFGIQNPRIVNGCAVDTDGDGIADHLDADGINVNDIDSDGDGILDSTEGGADTDGDGVVDYLDTDSDGDGIDDSVEGALDTDGDGIANFHDLDSDGDGIDDSVEGDVDTDADGAGNFIDTDSDDDGISDEQEGVIDTDADGAANYIDTDSDGDTIPDVMEGQVDTDGDNLPNFLDDDSDGDGVPDAAEGGEDTDGDSIPNFLDTDSDNDGLTDDQEGTGDSDGDGIPNYLDNSNDDTDGAGEEKGATDSNVLVTGVSGVGSMEPWTLLLFGVPGALLARRRRFKGQALK